MARGRAILRSSKPHPGAASKRRTVAVVTIICPWCEEDQLLALRELEAPRAAFTCDDCGTSVVFVEADQEALDLAA